MYPLLKPYNLQALWANTVYHAILFYLKQIFVELYLLQSFKPTTLDDLFYSCIHDWTTMNETKLNWRNLQLKFIKYHNNKLAKIKFDFKHTHHLRPKRFFRMDRRSPVLGSPPGLYEPLRPHCSPSILHMNF